MEVVELPNSSRVVAAEPEPERARGLLVIDVRRWRRALPWLWALAATTYVALDRWEHFKRDELAQAVVGAQVETVLRIVAEAQSCKPFEVSAADKRTTLIATSCLEAQNGAAARTP